jgi:hypothetical protein
VAYINRILSPNTTNPRTLAATFARHFPSLFAAIGGWEEVEHPTAKLPIVFLEPGRRQTLPLPPLKTARTASLSPAPIVARCHPKVSEKGSPRCHDAIGEDLIENGGSVHRIWPTPVSHRRRLAAASPGQSRPHLSIAQLMLEIKRSDTLFLI